MRRKLLILMICAAGSVAKARERDSLLTVFWNLENFYDYHDDGTGESDQEFSSQGSRRWTSRRFYSKCHSVAKSLFWIGDRYGRMPDVVGLAEIENMSVLTRMLSSTLLRKYDYKPVHRDSRDRRGIDVALLYRESVFELVDISFSTPSDEGVKMNTRDILHVKLKRLSDGHIYDFIVNHHPSKFGGAEESQDRRSAAMECLRGICDSLDMVSAGIREYAGTVAMGDFNDTPDAPQFGILDGRLKNTCLDLFHRKEGTIRYKGKWDLIDMFWVSGTIYPRCSTEILKIPFLMTRERKYPGERPLRTFSGPRYLGGVSDHCPVATILY